MFYYALFGFLQPNYNINININKYYYKYKYLLLPRNSGLQQS